MFNVKAWALFFLALAVSGCSIGPKYVRPSAPLPKAYRESADWKIADPQDDTLKGQWWKIFKDPGLNALEDQVLISNQNIAQAQAQYAQAYALVQAAKSSFFPVLSTSATYTRSHTGSSPANSKFSTQTILNANVTWALDLWGRIRKTIEANKATAQASEADLENAKLSAQAQLAQDYFQIAALDAQKQLLKDTAKIYKKFLTLTQNRYAGGVASQSDVLQAKTQLEGVRAQEIDLGVLRAQLEHAVALLIGKPAPDFSIPSLMQASIVPQVPVGLPSQILERRPDIAASERSVAAANALVGVAESAYFPTLTLSASGSNDSGQADLSRLFSSPNPLWSVGPALAETFFDAGLRQAQKAQAKAAYDADVAAYRQMVLNAIAQVEDNMAALKILEEEAQVQQTAVQDAEKAVTLQINQYKAGTVSALDVISTQAIALTDEKEAVIILGQRMNACVLLIQNLGGGWSAPRP